MDWYNFLVKVTQMWFLDPRRRGRKKFWDFITLLDLSCSFGEYEVLFMKIEATVLDFWFDTSFKPKGPKCSLYAPDPKVKVFFEIS